VETGPYTLLFTNLLLNREREQPTAIFEEFDRLTENFCCKNQNNNHSAHADTKLQ
jgi:hypothetical protein